jgi:hypothetical protein
MKTPRPGRGGPPARAGYHPDPPRARVPAPSPDPDPDPDISRHDRDTPETTNKTIDEAQPVPEAHDHGNRTHRPPGIPGIPGMTGLRPVLDQGPPPCEPPARI